MSFTETTLLSFCSTRTKNMIKNTNWKVPRLLFTITKKYISVHLCHDDWSNALNLVVLYVDEFMENTEVLKLRNSSLEFRFIKLGYYLGYQQPVEYYGNSQNVIQVLNEFLDDSRYELYKHFIDLFPNAPKIQLMTEVGTNLELVPVPEYVTDLSIAGEEVDGNYVEEYFSKCQDLQNALVGPEIKGQIMENSKITTVKRLVCVDTKYQVKCLVFKFNGQVASFLSCRCEINVVIDVLKLWISNEAFQNLERLSMNAEFSSFDNFPYWKEDVVLQAIESSHSDPTKRPENCGKKYEIAGWILDPLECGNFRNITRTIDGKRASFHVSTFDFHLVVWN
ncbi:hypothetical protein CAEBREN_17966 [Caenorhabditis brenneri]|uniref:F-box associated domain-containing protein n=1 Tax=Caenorhabditis brenneri TaxID=135651 RepID=G0PLH8_CAEBE|nr:hypothetical protein CAEBREN_17966 [Caenorhabditis brenneri]